jgi:hypothetical protein
VLASPGPSKQPQNRFVDRNGKNVPCCDDCGQKQPEQADKLEVAISGRNQVKTTEKDIDQWNVPEIKAERYATKKV